MVSYQTTSDLAGFPFIEMVNFTDHLRDLSHYQQNLDAAVIVTLKTLKKFLWLDCCSTNSPHLWKRSAKINPPISENFSQLWFHALLFRFSQNWAVFINCRSKIQKFSKVSNGARAFQCSKQSFDNLNYLNKIFEIGLVRGVLLCACSARLSDICFYCAGATAILVHTSEPATC